MTFPRLNVRVTSAKITVNIQEVRQAYQNFSLAWAVAAQVGEDEVPTDLESARISIHVNGKQINCFSVSHEGWHEGTQCLMVAPRLADDEMSLWQALGYLRKRKNERSYIMVNLEEELVPLLPNHALQQVVTISETQDDLGDVPMITRPLVAKHTFSELIIRLILPAANAYGDRHTGDL